MAAPWPFMNKEQRAKTKDEITKKKEQRPQLNAESLKRTPINLSKSYLAIKRFSILLLIFGVFMPTVWAQNAPLKPLMVGDKLPASFWEQKHAFYQDGKTTTQTLAQHKGKLLVLDFWATWCGSCINKFRTIELLQAQYKQDVVFLLVNTNNTRDNAEKIDQLLSGKKYNSNPYQLASIFNDDYINQLFPHGFMPYYVIISPNAEVRAIVPAELLNAANIQLLLETYSNKTKKGKSNG